MTEIFKVLNQYKENIPYNVPYVILINEKIVHASSPIKKLFKQDPTGMDMGTFMTADDKKILSERGHLSEGENQQFWKIGNQIIQTQVDIKNKAFDTQIISLVLLKAAQLQASAA